MSDVRATDRRGLLVLAVFTLLSLLGFASFGQHPELLARFPRLAGLYAPAFEFFARGHVIVAFGVLAAILWSRVGASWIPGLLVVAAISLGAELLGTATGFPFGSYRYTDLLGPRIADRVPVLIPVSWFVMALPAFGLATRVVTGRFATWTLGAVLLTTWDLTLDPAMSALTPYWVWEQPGAFYGMPFVNLLGWLATSLVIMAGLDLSRARRVTDRVPAMLLAAYYGVVLALSVGMVAVGGYWAAIAATAVPLALVWTLAQLPGRPAPEPVPTLAHEGGAR